MRRVTKLGLTLVCVLVPLTAGNFLPSEAAAAGFSDHELGEFYPLAEVDEAVVHAAAEAVVKFPSASGFLVDPDGLILTNHHVYESFGQGGTVWRRWVGDGSEQALTVELVSKDREHDVALYRVVGAHAPLPYLELRATPVTRGERVFVLGHPDGDPLRASFGKVLAKDLNISGRPSIEYSAQTWWGSSGSPVIDERGRAVAIHWGWDSTGISNGRLTGVPATDFTALPGFDDLGRLDSLPAPTPPPSPTPPLRCDANGWSLRSTLVDDRARKNSSGRWLDQVELRAVHDEPACAAEITAVTFHLHPTFRDPVVRVASDRLTLYSWGFFDATIAVELTDGREIEFVDRVAWR